MTYTIILTKDKNGNFQATVPSLPNCNVKAKSRSEAIRIIREAIAKFISRSEIIQLDVHAEPKSGKLHHYTPWESFGAFKSDPTWGKLFDEIEHQRNANED
jgi:predicted RNase H-like HicB family nuclease